MTLAPRSQRGSTLKGIYRTMLIRFLKTQRVKKKGKRHDMACLRENSL
jgi:hypothetical protein